MARPRGTRHEFFSQEAVRGQSDGAEALSMWSNHGCIITSKTADKEMTSQRRRSATRKRKSTTRAQRQDSGDGLG